MAMDSDTLSTASIYLNNLLLTRGLLRNGKPVDFAKPTRETRAQIINLVHDLLLKRDRDEESKENAADTIRTLRSNQERKDAEIEKLRTRLADKERSQTQAQVETRNAKADLKRLQTSVKALQTQLSKTKALADQIKIQCANDIRKRDLQIERLKAHLQGQQRGNRSLIVAPSINISGGGQRGQTPFNASVRGLQDPEYSLKQESNEFLTQLSASLSDENDGLISLVQGTLVTLRGLLGVESSSQEADNEAEPEEVAPAGALTTIAADIGGLLETLKSLLTNPNFVSVEEVDIRDEEILRLREGWEKMEARWGDVLIMMDGWRKRLEKTGDTINLDDLRMGLGLGAGIEEIRQAHSPSRLPRPSIMLDPIEEGVSEADIISRDSGVSGLSGLSETSSGNVSKRSILKSPVKETIEPPEFFDLRPPKSVKGQKLKQLSENFQSPRRVAFSDEANGSLLGAVSAQSSTSSEMMTSDLENHMLEDRPRTTASRLPRKRARSPSTASGRISKKPVPEMETEAEAAGQPDSGAARSSSFLEEDVPDARPMTMQDKLRAAQTEAESARMQPPPAKDATHEDSDLMLELGDQVGSLRSPAKKTKIKGRPRRRKSTLSPEELESLLGLDGE